MAQTTGPKISSRAMRISGATSEKTVGLTKKPLAFSPSLSRSPPQTRRGALFLAALDIVQDAIHLAGRMNLRRVRFARPACARAWPVPPRSDRICLRAAGRREPALHTSPLPPKMPQNAPFMAASKSASGKTMLGDLPPSSRLSRLRLLTDEACSSLRAVAMLPVKLILSTSSFSASASPVVGHSRSPR